MILLAVVSDSLLILLVVGFDELSYRRENIRSKFRCKVSRLLFAYDLVLLVSSESGLQHTLNGYAAAGNIDGIKISPSKTVVLHPFFEKSCSMFFASKQSIIETR